MELLFKCLVKRELLWFLLLFYSTFFKFVQGVVTQMPSHACVGEDITVDCDVSVPDPNNNFRTNFIEFIVGSSDVSISDTNVNADTGVHGGVNLSRLTAFANNSFSGDKIIRGSITLSSYTTSDAGIRLGCATTYFLSGNAGATDVVRETTLLRSAAPPPAPSMLSISSNIDPNACSATVSLNWIPPSSTDRTVDLYYLSLQNGTRLDSISATVNSYSHNTTLLLDTVYAYSVSASSCAGNSTAATSYLDPKNPPSPPNNIQSSVSNFNTATCSAHISLSWNTPSDILVDRYFLYLDESPLATTNSSSYIHSTILNINTDYQYSVTAMSCVGNSTTSSMSNPIRIASYSLTESSQFVCLAYNNGTGVLTINWGLSAPTQPSGVSGLDIAYSLQLLYSHSRQGVTYTYTDSTSFTLPSSQLSYNTTITAHNFTQLDGVETNITANLKIVQQCGQSFSGTAMECFFDSNNPPTPPASTALTDIITQTPTTACEGERVSVSCGLNVTGGQKFQSSVPSFFIGNSTTSVSATSINNSISHPDVNLTRLTAYTNAGNLTMVSGVVTLLSYQTSDEGLRIGCEMLLENGTEIIIDIQLTQQCPVTSIPFPVIIGFVAAVVFLIILTSLIILIVLFIIIQGRKKKKEKQTGPDGSGVKEYKGLEEDTYSQVNKKPKSNPKPVKKDENELTYLEIDHSSGTGKIVKPPTIPITTYADIADLPKETQYASLQN